jgi:hypothetical protein
MSETKTSKADNEMPRNAMQAGNVPDNPKARTDAQREAAAALEVAKEAASKRRVAPIATGRQTDCTAKQTIDRIAAKYGGQFDPRHNPKAPFRFFFDERKKVQELARRGVEVEIENGEFVHNESDVLYREHADLYMKARNEDVAKSNRLVADIRKEEKKQFMENRRASNGQVSTESETEVRAVDAEGTKEWDAVNQRAK